MPPGAPAGRCAGPAHTGLRGARGTPMPDPVLGAQGRGLRAQGSAHHPQTGPRVPAPGRLGRHTCSRSSHGELCVRRRSTRRPRSGSCPRVLGGCRDAPTGARTAGGSITRDHLGEALTGVPCCPPVPGSWWHRALPPSSPWKAGAGVPEDLRGQQPGQRSPGLPWGRLVLSSDREPSSARRRPLGGPQVMAWAQGPGKAQGTLHPQPKDGGPHKHREGERAVVLRVGIHPQEGSPASEAGSPLRPWGKESSADSPLYPGEWYGAPATERPFSVRRDAPGCSQVTGQACRRQQVATPLTEEAGRQASAAGSPVRACVSSANVRLGTCLASVRGSCWCPHGSGQHASVLPA